MADAPAKASITPFDSTATLLQSWQLSLPRFGHPAREKQRGRARARYLRLDRRCSSPLTLVVSARISPAWDASSPTCLRQ